MNPLSLGQSFKGGNMKGLWITLIASFSILLVLMLVLFVGVDTKEGPPGKQGIRGEQGVAGPAGPIGPRGMQGPKGDTECPIGELKVIARDGANQRTRPDINAIKQQFLPYETCVADLGDQQPGESKIDGTQADVVNWSYVFYKGNSGWVISSYLK